MKFKEKIDFKYNLRIYFSILRPYLIMFFALLFNSFLIEGSLSADKYLFKLVIDKGTDFISGKTISTGFLSRLSVLAGVFFLIIAYRAAAKWLHVHLLIKLESNMILDLKRRFFNHLLFLDYDFHATHKSGALISRLSRGSRAMENMTDTLVFQFATLIFQVAVVSFSLALIHWTLAATILATVALFIGFSFFIEVVQQSYNLEANKAEDSEKGLISDVFTNIESIKYYGKENIINARFDQACRRSRETQVRHWNFFRWWDSGQTVILGLGTFMLVYLSVTGLVDRKISIGTLVFIFTLYGNLVGPLFMFVFGIRNFYRSMADFESLFRYNRIERRIKDKPRAGKLTIKQGMIEFRNVCFKYHKQNIFEDFNLKIKPGEKVAVVGPSGCGKTTLIKLLYRLYDADRGMILVDGRDIRRINQQSLRSEMAVVPQECILFDDTIMNNISFSRPDAAPDMVFESMKLAQLDKIVKRFPDKENTVVGERGVKLSGGEKQRVSIARALLADKKVVVLDEATSSLDSRTEHEIQRDFQKLFKGRTAIIIAHRLSTIMNADRVIVLDKGRIVQTGKHRDLVRQKGIYRDLWNLQKNGYIE